MPGILWNRNHQPTAAAKSFAVIVRNAVMGTQMASLDRRNGEAQRLAGSIGKSRKLMRSAP
jgi:hypothetical protein